MPRTYNERNDSRARSRSRSPYRSERKHTHRDRSKDRSGHHHHHHHHAHHHGSSNHKSNRVSPPPASLPAKPIILPFRAVNLSKYDLDDCRPMFASYLDIQKQIDIEDLTEDEVKGRWKSFVGKWNRGELAEGWYDPATKQKAIEAAAAEAQEDIPPRHSVYAQHHHPDIGNQDNDEEEDDDAYGPVLPEQPQAMRPSGPTAPNFQDLALRSELTAEAAQAEQKLFKEARTADRRLQKDALNDLAPRAEPGTKERQLEKKRENAAAARTFRDAKGGAGEMEEVREADLLGGGEGLDEVKRMKKEGERRKNEREVRREEVLRARAVEREERLQVHREREEKTMEMLRGIARERFG